MTQEISHINLKPIRRSNILSECFLTTHEKNQAGETLEGQTLSHPKRRAPKAFSFPNYLQIQFRQGAREARVGWLRCGRRPADSHKVSSSLESSSGQKVATGLSRLCVSVHPLFDVSFAFPLEPPTLKGQPLACHTAPCREKAPKMCLSLD